MGEREWVGLAGLGVLLILLLLRIPVGLAMVVTGIGGAWVLSLVAPFLRFEPYLRQFKTLLWDTVANYELSVVPLFILMGYLAAHGGLSRDLFRGFYALVGRWPGGVAVATVGACAGFGAVCGSSLATASTMGRVALPELYRVGYAPALATGVLAAGGTLGILIPPSVALVLYSVVVEVSIIDAFRAAVVPGLMAVVAFAGLTALTAWRRPDLAPSIPPPDPRQRRRDLAGLVPVALIFAGLLVGLGLGLFTPTPAAGIGVLAVLGYGLFKGWRGHGLGWHGLRQSLLDTAVTAGMIYFILFAAEVLKGFFARAGLPAALAGWAAASGLDPWVILALMLLALIALGCFMESLSMILVVVPFFWPVLVVLNGGEYTSAETAHFGLTNDELKLWFGILALVAVELGLITPPVGLNVFIIHALNRRLANSTPANSPQTIPDPSLVDTFKGVGPFFAVELLRVGFLLAFPLLTLALPRWLAG